MTTTKLRSLLLALTLAGILGLGAELLLLDHTEAWAQKAPLVSLAVASAIVVWYWWRPSDSARLALRVVMGGLVAVSLAGLYFHVSGNLEFELEMHPSASGFDLVWEALRGATPALAPGALAQLGLLGLLASIPEGSRSVR